MSVQIKHFYEFGPFLLDTTRHLLLRDGEVVPLTPKAFETLAMLVQNNGRVVEKEELMKEIWPDTFVEEGSLARNISVLRKTLGEGPSDHQFIETVPKRGYRFVASVREVLDGGDEIAGEPYATARIINESGEGSTSEEVERLNLRGGAGFKRNGTSTTAVEPAAETPPLATGVSGGHTASGDWRLTNKVRRNGRSAAIILAALIIAAFGGTVYALYRLIAWGNNAPPPHTMQVTRFTTTGKSIDAAISPDGKYVVYVVDDAGQQSLWVRQVAAASNVQVVPPADVSYQGLTFSPDGNYVYYNMWDKKGVGVIYQVPVLGGTSRKVIVDVMPSIAISPDGKQLAFIRGYAAQKDNALIVANVDGTAERKLATRGNSAGWFGGPAWSPDGRRIAYTAGSAGNQGISYMQVLEVPAEGGPEKPITPQRWLGAGGLAWLGDGSGLVVTATDQARSPLQIWLLSYPGGEARKISSDVNGYYGVSLTADSKALVTVQEDVISNIWAAPSGAASFAVDVRRARKITGGKYEGFSFSWTPDHRIVYRSWASGNADIWIMDQDGNNKKQLTDDVYEDFDPTVTSDGRHIVFISNRAGTFHLWRMDTDGGDLKQLTDGGGEWAPYCSPDGQWVVYISSDSGRQTLWKVSTEGGAPVQLTSKYSYMPVVSPDGRQVAYSFWDEEANPQQWGREIIPIEGTQKGKPFNLPSTAVRSNGAVLLRWTLDGRALTYVDNRNGIANLWSLPLDGGKPVQLTDFKDDRIFWFDWSRDGKQLAVARGVATSDVVLISDFR